MSMDDGQGPFRGCCFFVVMWLAAVLFSLFVVSRVGLV